MKYESVAKHLPPVRIVKLPRRQAGQFSRASRSLGRRGPDEQQTAGTGEQGLILALREGQQIIGGNEVVTI